MKNSIFNAVCKTRYLALLVVLILTCGNAWGTVETSTFTNSSMGVGTGEPTWSSSTTPTGFETNGRGVQWSKASTTLTNTSLSSYSISQVDIVASANGSGGTITVTVGSTSFSSSSAGISSGDNNVSHSFTGSATTGNIQIGLPTGGKSIWVKSISVTYSSCDGTKLGTPVVTATVSSGQIILEWENVTDASSYKLKWNGGSWENASSGVTKSGLQDGTPYTYQVQAIGNGTSTCDGDPSAEASAIPGTYYTVTWNADGSSPVTTSVRSGTRPAFPSNPSSCDGTSTAFVGWTKTPWGGKKDQTYIDGLTTEATKVHTTNSTMSNITANGTVYYAVFAKAGAATGNYVKGSISNLTAGQTVIIVNSNSGYALSSETDYYDCLVAKNASISSNTISSPALDLIFTVDIEGNGGYSFKQSNKYLEAYYNNLYHLLEMTNYLDEWDISGNGPYVFTSTGDSGYKLYYNSSYSEFETGTGTGDAYNMDFYIPEKSYSDYLTTCCTAYNITLTGGGTISGAGTFEADKSSACSGTTITLSKDICAGYTVGDWSVYETETPANTVTVTNNQFTMPAAAVTVNLSVTAKEDHFIDQMHETSGYTGTGYAVSGCNQTVPNLSNKTPASECEGEHYKFVGWVNEDKVDTDGTLKTGYSIVAGGTTSWNATGTNYIAIWAAIE